MQVAHLQREASETSRKGGLREHLCLDLCHQQIVSNSPIEVPPADYFARLALDSRHIDIETGFPNRLGRELAPFAPAHGAKDLFFLRLRVGGKHSQALDVEVRSTGVLAIA